MARARYFTREEAEALLPRLRPMLEALREAGARLDEQRQVLAALQWKARGNGHDLGPAMDAARAALSEVSQQVEAQIRAIMALGVEVKDIAMGLVDFPALRDGRVVYLCWRLGEPRIEYWHELDAGFAGRQRL